MVRGQPAHLMPSPDHGWSAANRLWKRSFHHVPDFRRTCLGLGRVSCPEVVCPLSLCCRPQQWLTKMKRSPDGSQVGVSPGRERATPTLHFSSGLSSWAEGETLGRGNPDQVGVSWPPRSMQFGGRSPPNPCPAQFQSPPAWPFVSPHPRKHVQAMARSTSPEFAPYCSCEFVCVYGRVAFSPEPQSPLSAPVSSWRAAAARCRRA